MSGRWLRALLALLLILILAGAVLLTILNYAWLDRHAMAGVVIVGLAFFAIAILSITAQLRWDFEDDAPARQVIGQFALYLTQMLIFIPAFVGGIWLLLVLARSLSPHLPGGAAGLLVIIAFTFYAFVVIRILQWLNDRGIIGGRF